MTTIARKPPTFEEEIMERGKVEFDDPTFREIPQCADHSASFFASQRCSICGQSPISRISLEAKLEIAVKALEHYADEKGWSRSPDGSFDWFHSCPSHGFELAAKALAEIAEARQND